ncbi:MAG: hypothetical protein HXS52_14600 [Theionarchaea archaeon]|nr:hypothetical protein [Theionarchaea archaeon]MBU7039155.1 hypothetical protein [Theionarchaea archaeon]
MPEKVGRRLVAVARKLSVFIYHMLKRRERYNYFNPATYVRKFKRFHRLAGATPNRLRMATAKSAVVSSSIPFPEKAIQSC